MEEFTAGGLATGLRPGAPAFPRAGRDLTGCALALVARSFVGEVPADSMVVHVNNAYGWGCVPRCDELFTVINSNLELTAGREFLAAAAAASVIRCRVPGLDTADTWRVLGRILPPNLVEKARNVPQEPALHPRLTTGILAAVFYAARGADVTLYGYSRDRHALLHPYHKPAAALEQQLLESFKLVPQATKL